MINTYTLQYQLHNMVSGIIISEYIHASNSIRSYKAWGSQSPNHIDLQIHGNMSLNKSCNNISFLLGQIFYTTVFHNLIVSCTNTTFLLVGMRVPSKFRDGILKVKLCDLLNTIHSLCEAVTRAVR